MNAINLKRRGGAEIFLQSQRPLQLNVFVNS